MANVNKSILQQESNNTYVDNNAGLITPSGIRSFNTDLIDSLASQDQVTNLSGSYLSLSASYVAVSGSVANLASQTFISASQTASMVVASASYSDYAVTASYALNGGTGGAADTASLLNTASFNAYTASQASKGYATTGSNTFVDDQVFGRNITVDGTASINYLFANVISQSIVYSSGSNTLGDSSSDVQTLVGTTNIVGTLKSTDAILTGSFRGDLNGTASMAISSSYAYSASNADTASYVNLENDTLSFQNRTGILKGGAMSIGAGRNKFTVAEGKGQVISQSLEGPNYIKTTKTVVQWSTRANIDLDYLLTHPVTFVYIDGAGDVYQQTSSFTNADFRNKIVLGSITHADNLFIDSVENDQIVGYNSYKPDEYVNIFGVSKIKGLQPLTIAGTNQLSINSGSVYHNGANYISDQWNANTKDIAFIPTASFTRVYQSASTYVFDNSASISGPGFYDHLDFNHYASGGLLVTASQGFFTTQRIYQHPDNPTKLFAYYGPQEYQLIDDAVNAIAFESFEESEATKFNTAFLGYIVGKQGTSNLADPSNGVIIYSGVNRSIFLSTGTNIGALQAPLTALTYCYTTPSVTWSLQHNLQVDYPVITAYKSESKEVILPATIKSVDNNTIDLYFAYPFAGCVTVAAAGAQIIQAPFEPGGISTASFNAWTGSGDSQFSGTASYAITASYVLGGTGDSVSASWASSSISASFARTASYALNVPDTASYSYTASYVELAESSSYSTLAFRAVRAFTASRVLGADVVGTVLSSSYAETVNRANVATSASYASYATEAATSQTSSFVTGSDVVGAVRTAFTASYIRSVNIDGVVSSSFSASHAEFADTASLAHTASSADNFYIRNNLRVIGVISASSIYTESASVVFTSGSNTIGNSLSNIQALTGSVGVTGSFVVDNASRAVIFNLTGSLYGTASYAELAFTASVANTASFVTGSNVIGIVNRAFSASLSTTASFAFTSSWGAFARTASFIDIAQTASYVSGSEVEGSVSSSYTSSLSDTASFAFTASWVSGSNVRGTVSSSFTSSLADLATTASYILRAQTASFVSGSNVVGSVLLAETASRVLGNNVIGIVTSSLSASFVSGAVLNYPDPFTTTAVVTNIVSLTTNEFTALTTKNANTLYIII